MLNHFTFNGHSTGELGLLVSGINIYGSPSRIVEKVTIPYRSGDLIIDTGAYTNYMLTYTVDIMDNTKATAEAISKWLLGSKGYCELTDTYNPEIYRVASYYNQLDYTLSALYRYGKATITFDCKPQKYLTANQPVSLSSTLSEETSYSLSTPAMPLPLTLEGNTTQGADPTPDAPQQIHSVKGDNEVRVVGFNIWDEVTANGYYGTNGAFVANASYIAGKNKIPLLPSTQYCITSLKGNLGRICFYNADGTFNSTIINYVGATVTKYTFTTNADVHYMAFDMRSGYGTTYTNDICVNVSDTEKNGTYEPYKAQVYPINLPTENLFDVSALVNLGTNVEQIENGYRFTVTSSQYGVGIPVNFGEGSLYITCKARNITGTNLRVRVANTDNSAYDSDGTGSQTGTVKITFVTNSTKTPSAIRLNWSTAGIFELTEFMVSKLPVYTYTPYGVAPIELNALGNYKDYFYKSDGKWYLHKATNIVDLGTLSWSYQPSSSTFYVTISDIKLVASSETIYAKCPIYTATTWYNLGNVEKGMALVGNLNQFRIKETSYTSATDFKEAMSGVPLYYALATPTNTEITNAILISQLNALSKAKTYDGSTTIMQEGTDAQFKLSMPVPTEISSEYFGEPIITVSETGTIVWNDSLIKVNSAPVTINSQTLQCYYYSENKNNDVEVNEFPKYEQGENYIGSTMALTVVPNYWKL